MLKNGCLKPVGCSCLKLIMPNGYLLTKINIDLIMLISLLEVLIKKNSLFKMKKNVVKAIFYVLF